MELDGREVIVQVLPTGKDHKDEKWYLLLCSGGVRNTLWHVGQIQGFAEMVSTSWTTCLVTSADIL